VDERVAPDSKGSGKSGGPDPRMVAGAVAGAGLVLAGVLAAYCFMCRRRRAAGAASGTKATVRPPLLSQDAAALLKHSLVAWPSSVVNLR
jgi:hypothetical protein